MTSSHIIIWTLRVIRWLVLAFSILMLLALFGPNGDISGDILFTVTALIAIWVSRDWKRHYKLLGSFVVLIMLIGFAVFSQTAKGKAAYAAEQTNVKRTQKQEAEAERKRQLVQVEQYRQRKLVSARDAKVQVAQQAKSDKEAQEAKQRSIAAQTVAVNKAKQAQQATAAKIVSKQTTQRVVAKEENNKTQPASLTVTALPGRRIEVSGTAGIPNNETILATVEQKPSGFRGQSQASVINGTFLTQAFGPDGGLTPGFYTIQINYGNTEKESGFELRGDGSVIVTSSKYATAHAKPRKYGSYPMVNPGSYGSSTAEHTMADFLTGWKAHDWNKMLNATQLSWRKDQENPAEWLSNMYGAQNIIGAKINDVEPGSFLGSNSSSVTDITFTVYSKDTNGDVVELTTVGRVMREDAPMSLSSSGRWGVNPISTLNYGHGSRI